MRKDANVVTWCNIITNGCVADFFDKIGNPTKCVYKLTNCPQKRCVDYPIPVNQTTFLQIYAMTAFCQNSDFIMVLPEKQFNGLKMGSSD